MPTSCCYSITSRELIHQLSLSCRRYAHALLPFTVVTPRKLQCCNMDIPYCIQIFPSDTGRHAGPYIQSWNCYYYEFRRKEELVSCLVTPVRCSWVHTFSKNSTGICSEWTVLRRRPEQDEPSVVNLLGHIDKFGDILPSKYNVQQ